MKIAVTGSSGLIGTALMPGLRADGHEVLTLVRRPARDASEVQWDPEAGQLEATALTGVEAAIHLAGAGIADHRWTPSYKDTILRSRVDSTRLLSERLAALDPRPRVLLSGSAIGWYGDTGAITVDEQAPSGQGFLAEVVRQWEASTQPAEQAGIRVCHLRTGIVLSADGGSLAKQLPLYRFGFGGPLASGQQWQSWITLADEVAAIRFLLTADSVSGSVNLVAPEPVTQRELAKALGRALHRPAVVPTPAFAVRLLFPGFADEGVLVGQRVIPRALVEAGFDFGARDIDTGLRAVLSPH